MSEQTWVSKYKKKGAIYTRQWGHEGKEVKAVSNTAAKIRCSGDQKVQSIDRQLPTDSPTLPLNASKYLS